jgi:hypothetical protein
VPESHVGLRLLDEHGRPTDACLRLVADRMGWT